MSESPLERVVTIEKALPVSSSPSDVSSTAVTVDAEEPKAPLMPELSNKRKYSLLGLFCLSIFIDVVSASAFFVFTAPITKELNIIFEQQTWVITSYSITFASFLLFWGRVCDLFSAKPVFTIGFGAVGVTNLIISFMQDRYSFFVLRAISGIAGACVVPAAYRLIAYVFPDERMRGKAYTLYGMTGSLGNVSGTIIAGVFELIPTKGQMTGWRWFFRMVAVVVLSGSIITWWLLPQDRGHVKPASTRKEMVKAMDLPGIAFMLLAQILVIIGLTFGASYGWKKAPFIAPFLIGVLMYPIFFFWETRIPANDALLPPSTWRIPNVPVLIVFGLISLGWWACNFMPFIEISHIVHGERMVIAGLRTLPEGISSICISLFLIKFPHLIARPRWPIIISMLFCILGYTLWTQAPGIDLTTGTTYWKWVFPAMVVGSAGMQVVLVCTNVGVMLAAPAGREGVLGAMLQTSWQTSNVLALSIQAGLLTIHPGGMSNWLNVQTSWYFELGWTALWLIGFVLLYKPEKNSKKGEVKVEIA